MDFISIEAAAAKWGVSLRVAQRYCADGKIAGAKKYGRAWMIPEEAGRPSDARRKTERACATPLYHGLFLMEDLRLDGRAVDQIASALPDDEYRRELYAELALLQGKTDKGLEHIARMPEGSPFRLTAQHGKNITAIRKGDYHGLCLGMTELDNLRAEYGSCPSVSAAIDLAEATIYASVYATDRCPEWLKKGDVTRFSPSERPYALYLYALYLNATGQPLRMLGVTETALAFSSGPGSTVSEIYLRIMAANACVEIDRREQAEELIERALEDAVPYGIFSPFSEQLTTLRGVVEPIARQRFPSVLRSIVQGWKDVFSGWTEIRNGIANTSMTKALTAKEYQIALYLSDRMSYKEIASRMRMTVAATNYALQMIREKLGVKRSRDIAQFVNWSLGNSPGTS